MSRRRFLIPVFLVAALAAPAGAAAEPAATQGAAATGGSPAATTSSQRVPKAVVKIKIGRLQKGRAKIMSKVPAVGTLKPFAPRQLVRVDYFLNGRRVATKKARVRKGKGDYGVFRTRIRLRKGGKYAVAARYRGRLGADRTVRKSWKVRYPSLSRGECGRVVKGFKKGLREMGYIAGRGSCFKGKTARGVLAYRKANGMTRNFQAGKRVVKRVFARRGGYRLRHPKGGDHVEANLDKQVLVFAKRGRATHIYPISSGTSATPTVTGHYRFHRTEPGYNNLGMYYSWYFIGGYAIHGYKSVPNHPASHGCLRTFIADQPEIFNRIDHGESIYVY